MTNVASNVAGNNLAYDRKLAIAALHAARHFTCQAYAPLRRLLVDLLRDDEREHGQADEYADLLISAALGVMAIVKADEPRTTPWRGGPDIGVYAEAMHKLELEREQ